MNASQLEQISFALNHLPRRRRACPGDPGILSTEHQQSRWPGQARPRLDREGRRSNLTVSGLIAVLLRWVKLLAQREQLSMLPPSAELLPKGR